jgi:parallel beta-helix repeat protein
MKKFKPTVEVLEARCTPTIRHVGPTEMYKTIEYGVSAAVPGDTVLIDPGTYVEQVFIGGAGKNNITVTAVTSQTAIVQAPDPQVMARTNGAIIEVDIATGVVIDGLTLTGQRPAGGAIGGVKDGVLVRDNGAATVRNSRITHTVYDSTFNTGAVASINGYAVQVGDSTTGGTATVQNNTLDNYQKGGVWVEGANSSATVTLNTITGVGPTNGLAQFGVKVQSGASAMIDHNQISGDSYTGNNGFGRGINVTGGGTVTLDTNTLSGCDIGLSISGTAGATVTNNTASNNTHDGIDLTGSTTGATVTGNTANANGHDGIFVDATSTGNLFGSNNAGGNGGFDAEDLSTGTGTAGTGNTWSGDSFGTTHTVGGGILP